MFGFPDSFENPGNPNKILAKSKQKIGEIQTKNRFFFVWILQILHLDFPDFCLDFPFFVRISPVLNFLGRQPKQKLFSVWISPRSTFIFQNILLNTNRMLCLKHKNSKFNIF
jgi:hypothetical protein